jgi:heme O synthase-like polyprenyltransferase
MHPVSPARLVGGAYVGFAWRLVQQSDRQPARRLFFSSLLVLPLLLTALIVDLVL